MKIAIVTIYDGNNYGSFLQAFALKTKLEELGHDVFFVERMTEDESLHMFTHRRLSKDRGYLLNKMVIAKRLVFNRKEDIKKRESIKQIHESLRKARSELKKVRTDNLSDFDLMICGSDEIWNLKNSSIDVPFYSCVKYGQGIRKVAYAVSVGISAYEDFEKAPEVINQIQKFDKIFVRDENTGAVLRRITNKELNRTCDPTLLIDKEKFRKKKKRLIEEPYMLLYAYHLTKRQEKIISEYAKENHLSLISAGHYLKIADRIVYISPFDFANIIENADCCFTSTFHGTIFCSLFAKRYGVYSRRAKVDDVVRIMGVETHLWDGESKDVFRKLMVYDADRKVIDRRIAEIRNENETILNQQILNGV